MLYYSGLLLSFAIFLAKHGPNLREIFFFFFFYLKDVPLLYTELLGYTLCNLQCAGNRRTAMSKTRKVKGVGWDIGAIGNG